MPREAEFEADSEDLLPEKDETVLPKSTRGWSMRSSEGIGEIKKKIIQGHMHYVGHRPTMNFSC